MWASTKIFHLTADMGVKWTFANTYTYTSCRFAPLRAQTYYTHVVNRSTSRSVKSGRLIWWGCWVTLCEAFPVGNPCYILIAPRLLQIPDCSSLFFIGSLFILSYSSTRDPPAGHTELRVAWSIKCLHRWGLMSTQHSALLLLQQATVRARVAMPASAFPYGIPYDAATSST